MTTSTHTYIQYPVCEQKFMVTKGGGVSLKGKFLERIVVAYNIVLKSVAIYRFRFYHRLGVPSVIKIE